MVGTPSPSPFSVMPERGADTVSVLRGVARRGVDGARTAVNEQTVQQK